MDSEIISGLARRGSRVLRGLLTVLLLAPLACDARDAAPPGDRSALRIVVVTHGQSADPFWSVVSNGVRAGARDMGVRAEYQAPTSFDMVEMSNLIDAAVASRPAGLVVSIPDAAALAGAIGRATAAGIPVVSINSGADSYRDLGVLAHIGQTEYEAGRAGGERLAAAGARRVVCVNHEVGNVAQDQRCAGVRDALKEAGGSTRVLAVQLADPEDTRQRIAGALGPEPAPDGLITLGPAAAGPALSALEDRKRVRAPAGRGNAGLEAPPGERSEGAGGARVVYGTFDLTTEVLTGIADRRIAFAIDQQQYLQGYLPIVLLTQYLETLALPGGGEVIRTGPGFVTAESAAEVMELTRRGLR